MFLRVNNILLIYLRTQLTIGKFGDRGWPTCQTKPIQYKLQI